MKKDFFYENEVKVTKSIIGVLRWLVLVIPVIMLFSVIGLFQSKISTLFVMMLIGVVVTIGPSVCYKMGMPIGILKYVATISLGGFVAIMASDATIGIYMTYALAMVFSIFYFDKKFTLRISFISFFFLVASLFLRSFGVKQIEFETNFIWFVSRSVGFLIETTVMTVVSIKIAEAARRLLESLNDSQKVVELVKECNQASGELLEVVGELEDNITAFRDTNAAITESAKSTLSDCDSNQKYADYLHDETDNMSQNVEHIYGESNGMVSIAEDTYKKMEDYIGFMQKTQEDMKLIQDTAHKTDISVQDLQEAVEEVSAFANTIGRITSQTNLLALNASIEAARAGEAGKGFAVVAEEVRVLADNSKGASAAIGGIIQNISNLLIQIQNINQTNLSSVEKGINQINGAREEASSIGTLQMDSKEMAKRVSDASQDTRQSGQKLQNMSEEMQGLVQNLRKQTEKIVEESESQTGVTERVEKAFKRVEVIAQRLVTISKEQQE